MSAGLIALSALLIGLFGRIDSPWHWLGFVALAPFFAAVDRARSPGRALLVGWAMSVGYTAAAMSWFPAAIHRYTGTPLIVAWALLLLAAPVLQPQLLAVAWVRRALSGRALWISALASAGAYVGIEWAAPRLFADTFAYGLYPSVALRQGAELVGARGLTFGLVLVNLFVLEAAGQFVRGSRPAAARRVGVLALSLAGVAALGAWRADQLGAREGRTVRVGLVQANLTDYGAMAQRLGMFDAVRSILDTHYELSSQATGVDLLVWPETVYPTTFGSAQSEEGAAFDAEIAAFTRGRDVPLVFGAYDRDERAGEYNAAFLLEASAQRRAAVYRKAQPFPITEWVPEVIDGPRFRSLFPWAGTWRRGEGPKVEGLEIAGRVTRVAPLICYDALFPGHVAGAARDGAELLLTLSNDSWFSGSEGPRLHLIAAAFRSVETRLPQARATNSGISALISPTGEIVAATQNDRRELLQGEVQLIGASSTLVTRFGDWAGVVGLLIAVGVLLRSWRTSVR